jgi:arginyl-tRNA synthetase
VLYLTDARQALHFRQVFAVARSGRIQAPGYALEHLPFGAMLGTDGKPFKTRRATWSSCPNCSTRRNPGPSRW